MNIRPANFQRLAELGMTIEDILDQMLRLDRLCMPGLPEGLIGTVEQWRQIYAESPETWATLLATDNSIVAYWHFAPVGEDVFRRLVRGEMLDADLDRNAIADLSLPGHHHLHLTTFSVHPLYERSAVFGLMLRTWMEAMRHLAERRVFFQEMVIHAVTDAAVALCRRTDMDCFGRHPAGIGSIYTLALMPPPKLGWLKRHPELLRLYEEAAAAATPSLPLGRR